MGHDKLTEALRSLGNSDFFDKVYLATMIFIEADFYIPAMEVLSNYATFNTRIKLS